MSESGFRVAGPELPFKISVSDSQLQTLRQKLALTTLPDELDDAVGWNYGVPLSEIKKLVRYWKESFDWRAQEARLNATLPQFTRDITVDDLNDPETLNIHYVHQRSTAVDAIPLLFIHGWPGSFIEATKILPLLTATSAEHPSFHFVAYSLPGYGFSDGSKKKGFGNKRYAEVGHKLMLSLGYDQYGGDWGGLIARYIAFTYGPKHAKAFHTNIPLGIPPTLSKQPSLYLQHLLTPYSEAEKASQLHAQSFAQEGGGYFLEQSTKPQTLGYSLADSPVGLLAWIYEKLVGWADDYPWTEDEILTWISIYYFSKSGPAASIRIYYENFHLSRNATTGEAGWAAELRAASVKPPIIPYGISYFPKELSFSPRIYQRVNSKVVFEGEHDKGGHFAAIERPGALAGDLRKMFAKGGPAFGVVDGKSGY